MLVSCSQWFLCNAKSVSWLFTVVSEGDLNLLFAIVPVRNANSASQISQLARGQV